MATASVAVLRSWKCASLNIVFPVSVESVHEYADMPMFVLIASMNVLSSVKSIFIISTGLLFVHANEGTAINITKTHTIIFFVPVMLSPKCMCCQV